MSRSRILVAAMLAVLLVTALSFAVVRRFQGDSTKATPARNCAARTGMGAYDTALEPSSGVPGSTVTVSGPLPVMREDGTYGGQTASEVDVYWNLDFDEWWSVLGRSPSPSPSVHRSKVKLLGTQQVAKLCTYQVHLRIPTVPLGTYPIEVLYQSPDRNGPSFASFAPTHFRVTSR